MGWKFWKREQTEAEKSLEALQRRSEVASPPPAVPPEPETAVTPGQRHVEQLMRDLEQMVADVPAAEQGTFMLEVADIEESSDGSLVLRGGAHEGAVEPGVVVGVMVVSEAVAALGEDPAEQDRALLAMRVAQARVVSWSATPPVLVVSGVARGEITVGSMVTR